MLFIFNLNYKITLNLKKKTIDNSQSNYTFFYAPKCPQIKKKNVTFQLFITECFWLHLHCYLKTVQIYS